MKKLLSFLMICALVAFAFTFVNVEAVDTGEENMTVLGDGKYYIEERKEENNLPYGVNHYRDIGLSTTTGCLVKASDGTCVATKADGGLGESPNYFVPGQFYKQQVNVLDFKTSENLRVVSWANLNRNVWSLSTVKALANDFEAKNPGWKIIAAVNGDFFDIQARGALPYQSSGVVVSNGENYKTSGGRAVAFTNDPDNPFIGNFSLTRNSYMTLSVYDEDDNIVSNFKVEKWNAEPSENETAVYFAKYDDKHEIHPIVTMDSEGFYVENADLALPNNDNDFYGKGVISTTSPVVIGKGQFGIVSNNEEVNAALKVGMKIRVQFDFVEQYSSVINASGCGDTVLYNGEYHTNGTNTRHPRTIVGKKADGSIVMATVDGRQGNSDMYGVEAAEMAAIMKHYGCVEAYNLDGGGSTTLIIKKDGEFVVCNSPSDGNERTDSNALLVAVREPNMDVSVSSLSQNNLVINAAINDTYMPDIDKLYVEINNQEVLIESGKATIENLQSNTKYSYNFIIEDSTGYKYKMIAQGSVTTLKTNPIFYGLKITEDDKSYYVEAIWDDPDTAFLAPSVFVNDKAMILNKGQGSITKSRAGDTIESIVISLKYNLGDGKYIDFMVYNADCAWGQTYTNIILKTGSMISDIYN